jgi:hypothetical protein
MPIDPEHGAFEPEATAAMGEAFDAVCKELHDVGERELLRELIAKRIIAAASGGERDPVRLRTAALPRRNGRQIYAELGQAGGST